MIYIESVQTRWINRLSNPWFHWIVFSVLTITYEKQRLQNIQNKSISKVAGFNFVTFQLKARAQ